MTNPLPKRRFGRAASRAVRYPLVVYLTVLLVMTLLETWLVYPAPAIERSDWAPPGGEHEDVWFDSADGTRLHGWFYDRPDASRAVLYFHGNGEQVADSHGLMRRLRDELDATVLIFDYRGYGKSAGKPDEQGLIADGLAAQQWLAERVGRSPDRIVLVGRSLGGGVATALAADRGAEALVLISTFTRLVDVAARRYPWLPVRWLMHNRFDSLARVAEYRGPLWISHGTSDRTVPFPQAQRLFDAAHGDPKKLVELPGLGHNDSPATGYFRDLKAFLDRAVGADRETEGI